MGSDFTTTGMFSACCIAFNFCGLQPSHSCFGHCEVHSNSSGTIFFALSLQACSPCKIHKSHCASCRLLTVHQARAGLMRLFTWSVSFFERVSHWSTGPSLSTYSTSTGPSCVRLQCMCVMSCNVLVRIFIILMYCMRIIAGNIVGF